MKPQCTEEQFLKRVEDHSIEIIMDDGIDRRIRFSNNGSTVDRFDLITWQGHLLITGDMGSYLFRRVRDMFTFFRMNRETQDNRGLFINPMYWSQKVLAVDRHGDIKEWSAKNFKEHIIDSIDQYCYYKPEIDQDEMFEEAKYKIFNHSESEDCALRAAMDFSYKGDFPFRDYWEMDCKVYTYRFLWDLYAIVWGIKQYDKEVE